MALVSYVGTGRNISQFPLFVTVYIVKISTVHLSTNHITDFKSRLQSWLKNVCRKSKLNKTELERTCIRQCDGIFQPSTILSANHKIADYLN